MLELLYGCGIRNSELIGINLDDVRWSNEMILVRGKGEKSAMCRSAIRPSRRVRAYLPARQRVLGETKHGAEKRVAHQPARLAADHAQCRPHREADCREPAASRPMYIRTRCATPSAPTCWKKAPTCAPSRRCWATSGSRPRSAIRSSP